MNGVAWIKDLLLRVYSLYTHTTAPPPPRTLTFLATVFENDLLWNVELITSERLLIMTGH